MEREDRRTEIFETMPVKSAVMRQILPAIASQMITLIYNLADTYFVGMLNDPNQTAAVTVTSSTFAMLTAISNLFGVGGASLMARSMGMHDTRRARQVSSVAFWWGLVASLAFSMGFALLSSPVLRLCGATDETYGLALGYAKWVVIIGGPATILNTLMANLTRAQGSALTASLGVAMGGVANIILDPFFVLPQFLDMGAEGAGLATAISNYMATAFFVVYTLRHRDGVVDISPRGIRYTKKHIKNILAIGIPSAVQHALTVVAVAAQSKFVSKYTTQAVAALGIVKKLDQLPLYFSIGTANGLLPLLAYNHASGNQERRHRAFVLGTSISVGFALLCLAAYEAFAPALTGIFIQDAETRRYAAVFLRIMVTAMPMMAVCYPMITQFQAMGRAKESLICSVLRKGVVDIPLLFIMDGIFPLYGCMMVQPIVDSVALVVAVSFYRRIQRENKVN